MMISMMRMMNNTAQLIGSENVLGFLTFTGPLKMNEVCESSMSLLGLLCDEEMGSIFAMFENAVFFIFAMQNTEWIMQRVSNIKCGLKD